MQRISRATVADAEVVAGSSDLRGEWNSTSGRVYFAALTLQRTVLAWVLFGAQILTNAANVLCRPLEFTTRGSKLSCGAWDQTG